MLSVSDPELLFIPLGGTEEIGMNFNLYGLGSDEGFKWLIVDMGIKFGDDTTPGVNIIAPDPAFIEQRKEDLLGVILTHGHEDHFGAIPFLWEKLGCPIYATPFTASLLRKKLEKKSEANEIKIVEIALKGKFTLGPFSIELVSLTHSMPEPNAVVIKTVLGTIFHSGDWKFDSNPVVGDSYDEKLLKNLGDNNILAYIGDSTNVFVDGCSGSEGSLLGNLSELVSQCSGRVAVTCFASNVARLKTIFSAASANNRVVALVGRSLWRINGAARETGYLEELPPFLEPAEVSDLPKHEVLYICTGSQGEARAALNSIATGNHKDIDFGHGDTVIFSSRIIPGNELAIGRLKNRLVQRGITVISDSNDSIHVSGHPAREELVRMYNLLRPNIAIPVHGEHRHLVEHAAIAKECQVPETVLVKNGSIVKLAPGEACILGDTSVGKFSVEGNNLYRLDGEILRDRTKIMHNGVAILTLMLDQKGNLVDTPIFSTYALMNTDDKKSVLEELVFQFQNVLTDLPENKVFGDKEIGELIRIVVRRYFREKYGKKPLVTIHVVRM